MIEAGTLPGKRSDELTGPCTFGFAVTLTLLRSRLRDLRSCADRSEEADGRLMDESVGCDCQVADRVALAVEKRR